MLESKYDHLNGLKGLRISEIVATNNVQNSQSILSANKPSINSVGSTLAKNRDKVLVNDGEELCINHLWSNACLLVTIES